MSDFTDRFTIKWAINNNIIKVEFNAAQSSSTARAFAITELGGGTAVHTWPVVAPTTAAEVDQLFRDLRTTRTPYSDLMADTDIVARILRECQGIRGLKARERNALNKIVEVGNAIREKIRRNVLIDPLTVNEAEKLLRRQNINEANTMYKQAADMLKEFMTRRRLVMNNIIPLATRTAHAADLTRGVQHFGLRALMFEEGLFV